MTFRDGGFHPRFGTRNSILPLTDGHYLQVVDVLDHPSADKAPFGQAVRARSAQGGGWLGWAIAVDDLSSLQQRMGRPAIQGHRHLPDGTVLTWRQLGVKDLQVDPQLPFFVKWSRDTYHPSVGGREVQLLEDRNSGRSSARRRVVGWPEQGDLGHVRHRPASTAGPNRPGRRDLQHPSRRGPDLIRLRLAIRGSPFDTAGKPARVMGEAPSFKPSSNENPYPPLPGVIEGPLWRQWCG